MASRSTQASNGALVDYARIHDAVGFIPIPLQGKVPLMRGWQNLVSGADDTAIRLHGHSGNISLALPADLMVLDVDRKIGKDGLLTRPLNSRRGIASGWMLKIGLDPLRPCA